MKLIGVSLLAIFCMDACSGNEKKLQKPVDYPRAPTLNIKGVWQCRSKFTWTPSKEKWVKGRDDAQNKPPCDRDDIEIFKTDGSWSMEEGQTRCRPHESTQLAHGQWWASGRDSLFIMYNDGELVSYHVRTLTDSIMVRFWSLNRSGAQLLIEEQLVRVQ